MTDSKMFGIIKGLEKRARAMDERGRCFVYQAPTTITRETWVYHMRFSCMGREIRFGTHGEVAHCADDAWLVGKALDALEEEAT